MDHVIYLQANGEILRSFSGPAEDVLHQLAHGEAAVQGRGSWLTHKVLNGQVVALPEARVPPFDGAAWSPSDAAWFDPLLRADTQVQARAAARDRITERMLDLERLQARPLREILLAFSAGTQPSEAATLRVQQIDQQMGLLRQQLAALS